MRLNLWKYVLNMLLKMCKREEMLHLGLRPSLLRIGYIPQVISCVDTPGFFRDTSSKKCIFFFKMTSVKPANPDNPVVFFDITIGNIVGIFTP